MKRTPNQLPRTQALRRPPASRLPALLVALGLAAAAAAPLPLQAGGGGYRGSEGLTLDEAVSRVKRQTRARILSADTQQVDGRDEHRVRVLTDQGRVKGYRFDAGSRSPRPAERRGGVPRERRDRRGR